jgi:hypothetical protein
MVPRDRGTIVQVGSALAYRSIPLQSAYCAAKHAVQGFTDSLRCELQHDGSRVRVNTVHLPALNTPQFGWVKSRLPRRAQPVPPIYQPEVAAEAIHWAAHHDRRELWVGMTTVATILAERLAPGILEQYLAASGYDAQQTAEPEPPDRPHNLWDPLPGDRGAHGDFDDRAGYSSPQLWAATSRTPLMVGALVALLAAGAATLLASSPPPPRRAGEDTRDEEERRRDRDRPRHPSLTPRERDRLRRIISRTS